MPASDRLASAWNRWGNLYRRFGWLVPGLILADEDTDGLSPRSHAAITHQAVYDRAKALHVVAAAHDRPWDPGPVLLLGGLNLLDSFSAWQPRQQSRDDRRQTSLSQATFRAEGPPLD